MKINIILSPHYWSFHQHFLHAPKIIKSPSQNIVMMLRRGTKILLLVVVATLAFAAFASAKPFQPHNLDLTQNSHQIKLLEHPNSGVSQREDATERPDPNGKCDCPDPNQCDCCVQNLPVINSICLNITWYTSNLTVVGTLSVNGIQVVRKSFTDDQPLQLCVNAGCTVCVDVPAEYLNITNQGACGEVYLNVTCFGIWNQAWDLGQFHVGQNCQIPELDNNFAVGSSSNKDNVAANDNQLLNDNNRHRSTEGRLAAPPKAEEKPDFGKGKKRLDEAGWNALPSRQGASSPLSSSLYANNAHVRSGSEPAPRKAISIN
jgi:hypothetical protein